MKMTPDTKTVNTENEPSMAEVAAALQRLEQRPADMTSADTLAKCNDTVELADELALVISARMNHLHVIDHQRIVRKHQSSQPSLQTPGRL